MEKVRCNNCMNVYEDQLGYEYEGNLIQVKLSDDEFITACPVCKTDEYLMDM